MNVLYLKGRCCAFLINGAQQKLGTVAGPRVMGEDFLDFRKSSCAPLINGAQQLCPD
jgi:hypothetical protein